MNIAIASGALAAIIAHARAEAPNEACGILFGDAGVEAAEPSANVAIHPARGFEIDPAALLRAHRVARGQGRRVLGWYHSHPNGVAEPSATDAARAVEDGRLWLIATDCGVAAWRAVPGGPVHGRFAPVALVGG